MTAPAGFELWVFIDELMAADQQAEELRERLPSLTRHPSPLRRAELLEWVFANADRLQAHWKVEEFVIGGWAPPRPRHGWGLLVGEPDDTGAVRYLGRVELGVSEDLIAGLRERLRPLVRRTSAFVEQTHEPDATYAEPYAPVEIRYLERTSHGRLRHPAFRQLGGRWNHSAGRHIGV